MKKIGMVKDGIVKSSFFVEDATPLSEVKLQYRDIADFLFELPNGVSDNYTYDGVAFAPPQQEPIFNIHEKLIETLISKGVITPSDIAAEPAVVDPPILP